MPFVVTCCAFRIHRVSGCGRGKPVLFFILACSLAFYWTQQYTKIAFYEKMKPVVLLFCCSVTRSRRKRDNRQTDRHTHKPITVTLATHARQELNMIICLLQDIDCVWCSSLSCDILTMGKNFLVYIMLLIFVRLESRIWIPLLKMTLKVCPSMVLLRIWSCCA